MDATLLIALAAATVTAALFGFLVVVAFALAAMWFSRRKRTVAPSEDSLAGVPNPVAGRRPRSAPPKHASSPPSLPPAPVPAISSPTLERPVERPPAPPAPPPNEPLLGFFDDESSAPNLGARSPFVPPPKAPPPRRSGPDLFQTMPPGQYEFGQSDSEDGDATEIFSAHAVGGEFAEFMEETDDPGRARKSAR